MAVARAAAIPGPLSDQRDEIADASGSDDALAELFVCDCLSPNGSNRGLDTGGREILRRNTFDRVLRTLQSACNRSSVSARGRRDSVRCRPPLALPRSVGK